MKGKKSFILYCDLISTVDKLPDDVAGRLFKTILAYVNDQNPVVDDLLLQIAFEPVKQQLKRDLIDWEGERMKRSESGRLGGLKSAEARSSKPKQTQAPLQVASNLVEKRTNLGQANPSTASKIEANEAVTVTVTDNVTVNETQINGVFESLKSFYGFESEINYVSKWFEIREFLNRLIDGKQFHHFKNQFEYYQKYKEKTGEKKHSFQSFIDGGWNAENWQDKLAKAPTGNKGEVKVDTVYKKPEKPKSIPAWERIPVVTEDQKREFYKNLKPEPENPIMGLGDRLKNQFKKI